MTKIDLPPTSPRSQSYVFARENVVGLCHIEIVSFVHAWQISGNYFSHAGHIIDVSHMYMTIMALLRKYWRLRMCGK